MSEALQIAITDYQIHCLFLLIPSFCVVWKDKALDSSEVHLFFDWTDLFLFESLLQLL